MIWCPPGNAEQEANARLISAAPDLLAALEAFDRTYVRNMPEDHRDYLIVMQARAARKPSGWSSQSAS